MFERIRMIQEVSSTTGEIMFEQDKEYTVFRTFPDGAVIAMSERGHPEGIYPVEFEFVT